MEGGGAGHLLEGKGCAPGCSPGPGCQGRRGKPGPGAWPAGWSSLALGTSGRGGSKAIILDNLVGSCSE